MLTEKKNLAEVMAKNFRPYYKRCKLQDIITRFLDSEDECWELKMDREGEYMSPKHMQASVSGGIKKMKTKGVICRRIGDEVYLIRVNVGS